MASAPAAPNTNLRSGEELARPRGMTGRTSSSRAGDREDNYEGAPLLGGNELDNYETEDKKDENRDEENQAPTTAPAPQQDTSGDSLTWTSILILSGFVVVLVAASVGLRKVMKDTKVLSQSVVLGVGFCASVTYFFISVLVSNNPFRRDAETGRVHFWENLKNGLATTLSPRKIWEFFPSGACFGISQAFLVMGPLFVGPGLRNMFGQSKIPMSMLFAWLILGKKHTLMQWIIICCLAVAVAMFGITQKGELDKGEDEEGSSVKLPFGLIVILLGSAAAVLGGTLQEKLMKKEKEVSIFTQKFQTDISQIFITIGMLFLMPYIGSSLDLLQESCFSNAKPENLYLRQSLWTYRGVVLTVNDGMQEGKEFFEKSLRKFEQDKESEVDFLHDYYQAEALETNQKFWNGEFLKGDQYRKNPGFETAKYDSEKKYESGTGTIGARRALPHVKALEELKKKVGKLADRAAKSPYKRNLRMVAPNEWQTKIAIGGKLSTYTEKTKEEKYEMKMWTDEEISDAKAAKEPLADADVRGVYHRLIIDYQDNNNANPTDIVNDSSVPNQKKYVFCKFKQSAKDRVDSVEEFEDSDNANQKYHMRYFRPQGCFVNKKVTSDASKQTASAAEWQLYVPMNTTKSAEDFKVTSRSNGKSTDSSDFQAHIPKDDSVVGLDKLKAIVSGEVVVDPTASPPQSVTKFLWKELPFVLSDSYFHSGFGSASDIFHTFMENLLVEEKLEPNLVSYLAPFAIEQKLVFPEPDANGPEGSILPASLHTSSLDTILLDLHVRQGPIAAGVLYSSAFNEPKNSQTSFVCDDVRCAADLWNGYGYATNKGESSPFLDGPKDYDSGLFSGWTGWIALAVGLTMAQYFLNALVNKYVSVIWNKIAHTVATVLSFWVGEMIFDSDPESDYSTTQLLMLALLSVLVFSSIVLFLLSKEQAKAQAKAMQEARLSKDAIELKDHEALEEEIEEHERDSIYHEEDGDMDMQDLEKGLAAVNSRRKSSYHLPGGGRNSGNGEGLQR
ncbi:unnamed protein product [Amoebophrya sp. A120]|nr:unnamed protein product [Amoebophrya sp. A120]|eukprot:GSA120T00001152001.1